MIDFCLFCVTEAGGTSCWVKLNLEAMQKEHQRVHSKRLSLGKIDKRGYFLMSFCQNDYIF